MIIASTILPQYTRVTDRHQKTTTKGATSWHKRNVWLKLSKVLGISENHVLIELYLFLTGAADHLDVGSSVESGGIPVIKLAGSDLDNVSISSSGQSPLHGIQPRVKVQ